MATQEYSYMYGEAIVAKQQLEAVGIKVDFQVTDWATVLKNRANPNAWEMFGTGHGFVPDPSQISYVGQMNITRAGGAPRAASRSRRICWPNPISTPEGHLGKDPDWRPTPRSRRSRSAIRATARSARTKLGGWDTQFERGVKFWNSGSTNNLAILATRGRPARRPRICTLVGFESAFDGLHSSPPRHADSGDTDRRHRRVRAHPPDAGDPAAVMLGDRATPEDVADLRENSG